MSNQYIGAAPLTLVKRVNGTVEYVYQGGPVPGDADAADLDRLVGEGFVTVAADFTSPEPDAEEAARLAAEAAAKAEAERLAAEAAAADAAKKSAGGK